MQGFFYGQFLSLENAKQAFIENTDFYVVVFKELKLKPTQ